VSDAKWPQDAPNAAPTARSDLIAIRTRINQRSSTRAISWHRFDAFVLTRAGAWWDAWVMPCYRCGRIQTDPVKGASPWGRGVVEGEQILICPECQSAERDWTTDLDSCPRCKGTRLSVVLGSFVCRSCKHDWTRP
jgi:hypothetical protein